VKRIGLILALSMAVPDTAQAELQETPLFKQDVAGGKLSRVNDRLPSDPEIAEPETIGNPGGELRLLMGGPKDTRMMVVYGYARLVGYTPALKLVPDILTSLDVQDGRIFTLHLRPGHKWSDGHPFTSEDFRYWFEDVAQNTRIDDGAGRGASLRSIGRRYGSLHLDAA
jgi:peptide/nickel transport system substrate-binding protein